MVVCGAAGKIGVVLLPHLARRNVVIAVDLDPGDDGTAGVTWVRGSVGDTELLRSCFAGAAAVVHLATGVSQGWPGLLEVDIVGTRSLFQAACNAEVGRVVFTSTNHVDGGREREWLAGRLAAPTSRPQVTDPVRPDSDYGVAKVFGEAYGRLVAEMGATAVSCLRVGTVRVVDDPEAHLDSPEFAELPGGVEGRRRRLHATWLYHADLFRILDEELAATDRFRLRYAVSDNPGRFWPLEPYAWNPS